ncbi:MAG TPA: energy transducer TonB [Terriglobales bacterium]
MKKLGLILLLGALLAPMSYADSAERALLTSVAPVYPSVAKELKIGGVVKLRITIDAAGSVTKAETLGGNPMLVDSAAKAVVHWKYAPASAPTSTVISIIFNPASPFNSRPK